MVLSLCEVWQAALGKFYLIWCNRYYRPTNDSKCEAFHCRWSDRPGQNLHWSLQMTPCASDSTMFSKMWFCMFLIDPQLNTVTSESCFIYLRNLTCTRAHIPEARFITPEAMLLSSAICHGFLWRTVSCPFSLHFSLRWFGFPGKLLNVLFLL